MDRPDPQLVRPCTIEVHTGPMFSRKSLVFFLYADALSYNSNEKLQLFKPETDTRNRGIYSRYREQGQEELPAIRFKPDRPESILDHVQPYHTMVGIDEAHFIEDLLIADTIEELRKQQKHIVVAGLNTDFRGEPFDIMCRILGMGGAIPMPHWGACECGQPAEYTQRYLNGKPAPYDDPLVYVEEEKPKAGADIRTYAPKCFRHHVVPGKPRRLQVMRMEIPDGQT